MDLLTFILIFSVSAVILFVIAISIPNSLLSDVLKSCAVVCTLLASIFVIIEVIKTATIVANKEETTNQTESTNNIKVIKISYLTEEGALDSIVIDMDSIKTYKKK